MQNQIVGCILGTAVGDAIGLPYEGLSRGRAARILGPATWHCLVFGRGMVSDDTEHTCIVAQALISSGGKVEAFRRSLAWGFRLWLLGLPAGIGMATLRSLARLWIGVPSERSGVFSAGNGPSMRAAILGASIVDRAQLVQFARVSSRMTHSDPKAEYGAIAVALAARLACECENVCGQEYLRQLEQLLDAGASELLELIASAVASALGGQSTKDFADSLGLSSGVSGYTYHTVPVAIHAWLVYPRDFRSAVTSVVECGGDADSTAAIVGGIVGASVGRTGIPQEWLNGLCEWPRTVSWMEKLGTQLSSTRVSGGRARPLRLSALCLFVRNLFFLMVICVHGLRRLAPPY